MNCVAVSFLQPRILREFLADGGVGTALVVVCREDLERRIEPQHTLEETLIERSCIAARQIGPPRAANEQRIAGKHAVLDGNAHGIACMAGRVQRLQTQPADDQQFPALQAQIDEGRRARAMHHHRHPELASELLGCGEMIRVRVRIDEIADAQAVTRGERDVAVDLAELRINQCRGASLLAANHVRPASAGGDRLEKHSMAPCAPIAALHCVSRDCPSIIRLRRPTTPGSILGRRKR